MKLLFYIAAILTIIPALNAEETNKKITKRKSPNKLVLKLYEPSEFEGMPYRLMKPIDFDSEKTYPLILSLHGAGGKGTDNLRSVKVWNNYLADEKNRRKHPCFVLVPQTDSGWRFNGNEGIPTKENIAALPAVWNKYKERLSKLKPINNGSLSRTFDLIEKLKREYKIDSTRIYVLGHSMGGFGSWTAIWHRPDYFAAAIPCAGGLAPWKTYSKFKDVPVWAFHSADDPIVSVKYTRAIFTALKEAGGNMKYTEFDGYKHGSQVHAFAYKGDAASGFTTQYASKRCDKTQDVWDWLFKQKKKAAQCKTDYLAIVKKYANAMIKDGRDTYETKHSPLFASALDRHTMRIGSFDEIPGVRKDDRTLGGANPQEETGLYSILYRLTELSGEKRYANEADKTLEFFFSHCQSSGTGLMTWGEHLYWDFAQEEMGGIDSRHEIKGEWPFWNECYRFAPQACWKFAIGQWDHQIADKKTGDFSRHAKWSGHGPQTGADFPRYAGQMIANWADAYVRKENKDIPRRQELVTAISIIVTRMESNMKTPTGYLLAGTDKSHGQISWPTHNLELARCLWNSAPHMEDQLAGRMKKLALKQDYDFHRMPHTINSGGGFVATIDVISGLPRSRSMNRPYTTSWTSNYGQGIHASRANRCFARFEQIEKDYPVLAGKYQKLILSAANLYLTATPDPNALVKPETIASVITLMINSHSLTGEKIYLDRADYFSQLGIKLFLDDGLPLPKATNQHDHYETITGGPGFMHALLKLHEALDYE